MAFPRPTWLGHRRFAVAGHDRGGRVGYRMALDHPDRVERLAVLAIVPTEEVWCRADDRFALGWPWTLPAQAEPLAERILAAAAGAIVDEALGRWGSRGALFPAEVREAYAASLRDPAHAHAVCEEYRAGATVDRDHDRADRSAGRRIGCPVLVACSARGPLAQWYSREGGPLALWRSGADDVRGESLDAGHLFPEELPAATAALLGRFFS